MLVYCQVILESDVCGDHVSDRFTFSLSQTVIRKRRIWMYGQQGPRFPNKVGLTVDRTQFRVKTNTGKQMISFMATGVPKIKA